jgi:hypothetical protein
MSTEIVGSNQTQALDPINNAESFQHCMLIAKVFADSDLLPKHFQGKPANVFVALRYAQNFQIDPMLAIQNIYIINGVPSLSSQLLIALANSSGLIDGQITFHSTGKNESLVVTARAKLKNGELAESTFSYMQAREAGLTQKLPWKINAEQMLRYRAASSLIKAYLPHVAFGLHAKEEAEDYADLQAPPQLEAPKNVLEKLATPVVKSVIEDASVVNEEPNGTTEKAKRGRPAKTEKQPEAIAEPDIMSMPVPEKNDEAEVGF